MYEQTRYRIYSEARFSINKSAMLMVVLVSMVATASGRSGMAQSAEKQDADAYKAFFDANQARDIPTALSFAKAYLEKFPTGKYAAYLKGWVRPHLFNEAITAKKTDDMIRIGKEAL
ncbi:MAG TPA: hypothetical protein VGV87_26505, partial [Blastocatellia bacterium]|nr:hypothetical protein [Blastocatellia bacterium]